MHFGNCLPGQMSGEMAFPRWCTQGALTTDLLTKFLKEKLTSVGEFTREGWVFQAEGMVGTV